MSERWWQKFYIHTRTLIHVRRYPTDGHFACGLVIPSEIRPTNVLIGVCYHCRSLYDRRHEDK